MKTLPLALAGILFSVLLATTSIAQPTGGFTGGKSTPGGGGFSGSANRATTVVEALSMPDDTRTSLRGSIESRIDREHYLFRDNTGTITVEIDDDEWGGVAIAPTDVVVLYGEIDRDMFSVEFDVKQIIKQ